MPSLALLAAASAGTAFSSAHFVDRGETARSDFASGRLALSSARDGQAILDAAGLRPGQKRDGTVTITNDGDIPAHLTLAADDLGSATIAGIVPLAVDDCTHGCGPGHRVFAGKLAELASPADLGVLDEGESRTYRLRLRWPTSADDPSLQGAATTFHLHWVAKS